MTTVSRTFIVAPQPQTVIPYLADFAHAEEWDPGTERCVRNDAGPVVGSSWHNTSKIAGAAKLAAPLAKVIFEKLGNDTEKQLLRTLDGLAT